MNILNKQFIMGFVTALIILLSVFIGMRDKLAPAESSCNLAYVDLMKVTKVVSENIMSQNLPPEDMVKQIDSLRGRFDILISDYSKKHNKVLFSEPRPIDRGLDVTDELLKMLFDGKVKSNQVNTHNVQKQN